MNIADTLRQKIGPLPGYAWLGIVGLGAALVLPRLLKKGSTSTTPRGTPGTAPGGVVNYAPPAGFDSSTGATAAATAPSNPAAPSVPPPIWHFAIGWSPGPTGYIWRVTQQGAAAASGKGVQLPTTPQPAPLTQDILNVTGPYGTQVADVPSGYASPSAYIAALQAAGQGQGGGVGGHAPSIGSHFKAPAPFHPHLKRTVKYPHFVNVGGPGPDHQQTAADHAERIGVHPGRIQALNPRPSKVIRVA